MPSLSLVGLDRWRLDTSLTVKDWARRRMFAVPAGFETDLASIPRAFWPLVAPFELSIEAPVAHDFIYRRGGATGNSRAYTRAEADALFRDLMRAEGVPAWRRWIAYAAVRAFGWAAWAGDGARVTDTLDHTEAA